MNSHLLIQDLAIIMAVSAVSLLLCHLARLPVVLGYIIAGIIIGPYTPPYPLVTDLHGIETLSELGVIFLLFSIGLEFSLKKLFKVGLKALLIASSEILLMMTLGYLIGYAFAWKPIDAIFLGAILAISSTTIVAKIFSQMKVMNEKFAQLVMGILVVEDILAIFIIAILSGVTSSEQTSLNEMLFGFLKGGLFLVATVGIGIFIIPKIMKYILKFKIPEMNIIVILGLCFSMTILASKAGLSTALGAFLIGALIAETKDIHEVIQQMEPLRDMFAAIFFMSVGLLIDPVILWKFIIPILVISLVTILGKTFACTLTSKMTKENWSTSIKVGLSLAQIGEFSFIIAKLGGSKGVTSPFLYSIAVSVSVLTTIVTPLLLKNSSKIVRVTE